MFGYKIENGTTVVDEVEVEVVASIFNGYISGLSLRDAAVHAGRPMVHSTVKRMIRNFCYTGDEFHPAIISRQTFAEANAELLRRSEKHVSRKRQKMPVIYTEFKFSEPTMQYDDPIAQSEYIYSLIGVIK